MSLSRIILLTSLLVLSKTSFKVLILLGFILGNFIYIIPNSLKATTRTNLKMAFPDKNKEFINKLIKKSLRESSINLLVSGKVWASPEKFGSSSLVKIQGLEQIRLSLEQKNGVII